jgi:engulfment/cell motility protein 1
MRSPSLALPQAPQAPSTSNPLAITLLSHESVISEFIAPTPSILSEWLDGLNLLLPEGYISTKESADYIQTLTDIGVKIKLLDLSGERLDIPTALPMPIVPPVSVPFVYAE